jgi:phosphatidylserine/phosphatidylglycerophosphate/cardiolipin synthase-like enzyme
MTPAEFAAWLAKSLADGQLSGNEKSTLKALVALDDGGEARLAQFRRAAFQKAAAHLGTAEAGRVLAWLEGVLHGLQPQAAPKAPAAEAYFSPGDDCCQRLVSFLQHAGRSLDVCVFTITDDRISRALLDAHRSQVAIRLITDDEKALDLGSDVAQLRQAGIPVRLDHSPAHMHHKFALADGQLLLTGSFNWTRSAGTCNWENFLITGEPRLTQAFGREFERLWARFGGS